MPSRGALQPSERILRWGYHAATRMALGCDGEAARRFLELNVSSRATVATSVDFYRRLFREWHRIRGESARIGLSNNTGSPSTMPQQAGKEPSRRRKGMRLPRRLDLRRWELAGLLFDRTTRKKIYDPVLGDLRQDHQLARQNCHGKWSIRFVRCCFFLRASCAFFACARIALMRPLSKLLPARIRHFWRLLQ